METSDKIKVLKEQALDWIEKELSSDNPRYIWLPYNIENILLEEEWDKPEQEKLIKEYRKGEIKERIKQPEEDLHPSAAYSYQVSLSF